MAAKRVLAFFPVLACFMTGCCATSAPPTTLEELVHQQFDPLICKGVIVGASVGVIVNGETSAYFFGVTKQGAAAPNENTVYEIGSTSKVFTGTALAKLSLDGAVTLDAPVKNFLPSEVTVPYCEDRDILLEDLAEQNSGLPRMPANFTPKDPQNPYVDYTPEDLYAYLSSYTLTRCPGVEYEYSNLGVGLLGLALARSQQTTYEQIIRNLLLIPLGMPDTSIVLTQDQQARFAQGYTTALNLGFHVWCKEQSAWDLPDTFAGAGGIRSTLTDMIRFLQCAMGQADTPLKAAFTLAETPRFDIAQGFHIGLNWHLTDNAALGEALVWHNGETGGYHSFLGFAPGKAVGIIVLANTANGVIDAASVKVLEGIPGLSKPVEHL